MTNSVPKEYYTLHHAGSIGVFNITDVHRNALAALSLGEKSNVIDFGCGNGELITLILEKGAMATGIDFAHDSVMTAKMHAPNANIIEGDITTLSFPDQTFDRAVSLGTIGYLSKDALANHFAEAARMLKPKSLYVIRTATAMNRIGVFFLKILHSDYVSSTYFYPKSTYTSTAKKAGFRVEKSWRSYDSSDPQSFIKKIIRYICFPFFAPLWITFEKQ